jgi:hypothetical protein
MFSRIGPRNSRRFAALRHRLSKASMQGRIEPEEALQSFAELLAGQI